jgi:hypothetical protein
MKGSACISKPLNNILLSPSVPVPAAVAGLEAGQYRLRFVAQHLADSSAWQGRPVQD